MSVNYTDELGLSLEKALQSAFRCSNVCIIVFHGASVAVRFDTGSYYLFDSHSRDVNGILTPNGKCTLSVFETQSQLCDFLRLLCTSISSVSLDNVIYEINSVGIFSLKNQLSECIVIDRYETHAAMENFNDESPRIQKRRRKKDTSYTVDRLKLRKPQNMNSLQQMPVKAGEVDLVIQHFKRETSKGAEFVCTSCMQTWFKKSVFKYNPREYAHAEKLNVCIKGIKSVGNDEWICSTCRHSLKIGNIPTLSLANGMGFPEKPKELDLTALEERLISPRIPFMQIFEKPRGGQRSLRGNIVNVPSDVSSTMTVLPRTLSDIETVQVKLKRKSEFKHSVMHEAIRPVKCLNALRWLIDNSQLFRQEGIKIDECWQLTGENEYFGHENSEQDANVAPSENLDKDQQNDDSSDGWSEVEDFDTRLTGNTDTLLHPIDVGNITSISLAPGEGQMPLGLYQDKHSEILSFPSLFCGQNRPENLQRKVPVHYSDICRWELRSLDRRCANSVPNIFFKLKKLQIKQIQDTVTLAMRKCQNNKNMTAGEIVNEEKFKELIMVNEGYHVLKQLRGSPAYWEKAKKDIFAMIRHLGVPTWFCSLSAAETRWLPLLKCLAKLRYQKDFSDGDIEQMSWIRKCELIKSDPVTCARYFDNKVKAFIGSILQGKIAPLGKIKEYFYRVEFQQRGSPHIHMLVWIEMAPKFEENGDEELCEFIDKHVTCSNQGSNEDLINYQSHRHARTCRKKNQHVCRFGFPIAPMRSTRILRPFESDDPAMIKKADSNYGKIVSALQELKPADILTYDDFLNKLGLSEIEYIDAICSSLTSPKVFLKRSPSEVRINSYNGIMLTSWEANIDVQFVLDAYSCAAYIVSYISKGQRGMSDLLSKAAKEAAAGNSSLKEQVRHIGNKFLTHVEVGAQEAIYLLLQMPLRMCTRSFIFVNTNEAEKRACLLKPKDILESMPSHSTDIESDNNFKRYQRRPYQLNSCCLADFMTKYNIIFPQKKSKQIQKGRTVLPEEYQRDSDEECVGNENETRNAADLRQSHEYAMKDGTIIRRRRVDKIIRYVRYNRDSDSENYHRVQLMLFFPWRKEVSDLLGDYESYEASYMAKFDTVIQNASSYNCAGGILDAIETSTCNIENTLYIDINSEGQHQEAIDAEQSSDICDLYGCFDPNQTEHNYDLAQDMGITRKQLDSRDHNMLRMPHEEYLKLARLLNHRQQAFFYHVLHCIKTDKTPMHLFLSGGAGVGKSLLTSVLYEAVTRFYSSQVGENPDIVKAVLCAPTGKAAHNIGGSTIHSLFCIPANQNLNFKPLDMQQLDVMRVKFSKLKVIFIDEISMVGFRMFNFINMRLQEVFATYQPFGGLSIIAIGDLFQLRPVLDSWIFQNSSVGYGPLATNLWQTHFHLFELTEIMRQKDDKKFAEILNRVREGIHTDTDLNDIRARAYMENPLFLNGSIPCLFTTNKEVNDHNDKIYANASICVKTTIQAIDQIAGVLQNQEEKILKLIPEDPAKTMGLLKYLRLVENAPAEICINIDIDDGLTNGAACSVKKLDFRVPNSDRCSIIWALFESTKIGLKTRNKYRGLYAKDIDRSWTPILEISRKFCVGRTNVNQVTRRQFPLRLAAAKTIHKSQGSTMQSAILDFGIRKNDHMHYVGLSRVKSLEGIHILRLNENKISVSGSVYDEMMRMRRESMLSLVLPEIKHHDESFTIVYHNSRSLHKHFEDLKKDENMMNADIIAITESRLRTSDNTANYCLPDFEITRYDDFHSGYIRPFKGTVIYSKHEFSSIQHLIIHGVETTVIEVILRSTKFVLTFFYVSPQLASVKLFVKFLEQILKSVEMGCPVLLMGDANIDFFNQTSLSEYLQTNGMVQALPCVTTDYGSCLDHIYIKNIPNTLWNCQCFTLESYYSDHKPVVARLIQQC